MMNKDAGTPPSAAIAAQYVAGNLSDADAAAYEARVAEQPELYRDVELALRLKEGFTVLRERGELAPLLRNRKPIKVGMAVAAALAILVGVVWFVRTNIRGETVVLARSASELMDATAGPHPTVARYVLARTRGTDDTTVINLPAERATIQLALVPPGSDAHYDFSLRRGGGGGNTVGEIHAVAVDANGYVDIFVDSSTMRPGEYVINLRTSHETKPAMDEVILVVRPGKQ